MRVIVEYAGLVSAFALLAATLSGAYGQNVAAVFASGSASVSAVAKAARSQNVSSSGAKAAYKRAPYSNPSLRYLYAMGWIGGTKNQAQRQIRANPKLMTQLRRRAVSVSAAAGAVVKGVVSACA